MDNRYDEIKNNEIESVTGGISKEQLNQLPVGTRIKIISGRHAGKEAVIRSFVNDLMSNVRIVAWIKLDDGTEESITPGEFEVIG